MKGANPTNSISKGTEISEPVVTNVREKGVNLHRLDTKCNIKRKDL